MIPASGRFVVLVANALFGVALSAQAYQSGEVSLCTVAAKPRDNTGHLITVRARIYSGGMHGWYIADAACMRFGVALFLPADVQGSEAFYKSVNFVGMR